jgi:hypothetical protein
MLALPMANRIADRSTDAIVFQWIWALAIFLDSAYRLLPLEVDNASQHPIIWVAWLPAYALAAPLTFATLVGSLILLIFPYKTPFFWFVSSLWALDALAQMPMKSNHNIMMLWTTVGMGSALLLSWLRKGRLGEEWCSSSSWFLLFAPMGRMMLVLMYVFGIFHKINTDFLNPDSSCAVLLWQRFDFLPLFVRESYFWQKAAIAGTFLLEGSMLILLFFRGWPRALAILTGLGFHGLIALNSYQFYTAFTMLSFALHSLFLPSEALQAIADRVRRFRLSRLRALILLWALLFVLARLWAWYDTTQILFLLVTIIFMVLVWRYGVQKVELKGQAQLGIWSPSPLLNLLSLAFVLNCMMPYLGGKTGQALAMYSNLHTEGGRTNHLLFSKPPYLWDFQRHLVTIIATNDAYLQKHQKRGVQMTRYALQSYLQRAPAHTTVTFEENGRRIQLTHSGDHPDYRTPHPSWLRHYFIFVEADPQIPRRCSPIDEEIAKDRIRLHLPAREKP